MKKTREDTKRTRKDMKRTSLDVLIGVHWRSLENYINHYAFLIKRFFLMKRCWIEKEQAA